MRVSLYTNEVPRVFERFCSLVEEGNWVNRARKVENEIKGNPVLTDYLREENLMALKLAALSNFRKKHNAIPTDIQTLMPFLVALGFVSQLLSLLDSLSPVNQRRILGRFRGALKNPDDMRAMQVELLAATHFIRHGYQINWPEVTNGRHDIDIVNLGSLGLQVECKSVSSNKGRKIHRRDALDFYGIFLKELKKESASLETGKFMVLTVPDRLPNDYLARKQLGLRMIDQLNSGASIVFDDGIEIRIGEFDFTPINEKMVEKTLVNERKLLDQITGTKNKEVMIYGSRSGGGLITVIQSKRDDTFLESLFSMLEDSAKNQVSNTRPVLYFVSFNDLEDGELRDIGDESGDQPTALRLLTSRFLNRPDMDHVVGLQFAARGSLEPRLNDSQRHVGNTYSFKKDDSPFWEDEFEKLLG